MLQSRFTIICVALILSVSVVTLLFVRSRSQMGYGFDRKFIAGPVLRKIESIALGYDSYYIAGHTQFSFYLGNSEAPRHLIHASLSLDTTHITYRINSQERVKFRSVRVKVDSPFFYMMDGTVPIIFKGHLSSLSVSPLIINNGYFLEATPTGPSGFAVKSLVVPDNEMTLGRIRTGSGTTEFAPDVLKKQHDGIFCKAGMIEFDATSGTLIYVYYYRNQYIVMDSLQSVLYKGKTIDTTSVAKIEILNSKSGKLRTMARPPLLVNQTFAVHQDHLYINSSLIADNEDQETFNNNSVIDVYSLSKGIYLHSFYLPRYSGSKLNHFRVFDRQVIAIYPFHIVSYALVESEAIFSGDKTEHTLKKVLHVRTGDKDRNPKKVGHFINLNNYNHEKE